MEIGLPVLEKKIFEGFLPYMDVTVILVMLPRCREHTFVLPIQGSFTLNLALIGPGVSKKKMLKHCGRTDDGRTDAGLLVYYKLTYDPLAQVS